MLSREQWRVTIKRSRPNLIGLLLLAIGLAVGLLWAYAIAPTIWSNAEPLHLDLSYQDEWIKMVADQYALTGDRQHAETLLGTVENAVGIIDRLRAQNPDAELVGRLDRLRSIAEAVAPAEVPEPSFIQALHPVACVGGFLVVGAIAVVLWGMYGTMLRYVVAAINPFKRRREESSVVAGTEQARREALAVAQQAMQQRQPVASAPMATQPATPGWEPAPAPTMPAVPGLPIAPPLRQFPSVYMNGDDYFDDTFSIEDENDSFLGECGAGISDTVGVGTPKKVTAIEAWLFDKDDIRTVTKVIMSEYAYRNQELRAELASRGEPVLAQPGAAILLETQSLQVVATIVDMEYGEGGPAPNSFFQRLTLNLAAHRKAGAAGPPGAGLTDPYGGTVPIQ